MSDTNQNVPQDPIENSKEEAKNKLPYAILKLHNGMSIICQYVEKGKDLLIEQPMLIYEIEIKDREGNYKHHIINMRNLIDYTNDSVFRIPRSTVWIMCTPKDDIIALYEQNKEDEELDDLITETEGNDEEGPGKLGPGKPSSDKPKPSSGPGRGTSGWPWFRTS